MAIPMEGILMVPANDARRLAVTEAEAIALLGLNQGRSAKAAKLAFWKFRAQHEIKKLPGGVFSKRRLEVAAS